MQFGEALASLLVKEPFHRARWLLACVTFFPSSSCPKDICYSIHACKEHAAQGISLFQDVSMPNIMNSFTNQSVRCEIQQRVQDLAKLDQMISDYGIAKP
eukprot:1139290-Pelagomonas_calceolata.AAC.2